MASGLTELNQIHKREDILDVITRVDEKTTPFMARCRKGATPQNTFMQWTVDAYDEPRLGGVVDGSDVASFEDHGKFRAILATYLQTWQRTAKVTPLAQNVSNVAGVPNEMNRAVSMSMTHIARDMEATFLSDQEHQADDGVKPYLCRGLGQWIRSSDQALHPVPEAYRPAGDQIIESEPSEADFQALFQSIYDATGMSGRYTLFAGSDLRRRITDMTRFNSTSGTGAASREINTNLSASRIVDSVSVYEGDYGSIEVVSSNFIGGPAAGEFTTNPKRGYVLDMDKVVIRSFQQPTVKPLSDDGGGPRSYIRAIAALAVLSPIGLGKINYT